MEPKSRSVRSVLILAGQFVAVALLAASARADVYYYKDAAGVFHFTNVRRADSVPFLVERPLANLRAEDEIARAIPDSGAYDEVIEKLAKLHHVEPALVKAVIRAESGFNRMALSPAGARGLMQLMPMTAKRHGVRNIWDAQENIRGGVMHLRLLIDRHGTDLRRVLAAYNAGSDQVERHNGIPPIAETQIYVGRVLRFRQEYLKKQRMPQVARQF